jgi:small subunit ribosomal protein S8
MNINDPVGDMITRIRNAYMRGKETVDSPSSNLRINVLEVLRDEGFIRGYSQTDFDNGKSEIQIDLKYHEGESVIKEINRISKPGRRVYSSVGSMPLVRNGLGVSIISTSKGVMSDKSARTNNVGGEILCVVF